MSAHSPANELADLASYLEGFSAARNDEKMARAAIWLSKLAKNVCGNGGVGCVDGPYCSKVHI